jgi:hypothetical protein
VEIVNNEKYETSLQNNDSDLRKQNEILSSRIDSMREKFERITEVNSTLILKYKSMKESYESKILSLNNEHSRTRIAHYNEEIKLIEEAEALKDERDELRERTVQLEDFLLEAKSKHDTVVSSSSTQHKQINATDDECIEIATHIPSFQTQNNTTIKTSKVVSVVESSISESKSKKQRNKNKTKRLVVGLFLVVISVVLFLTKHFYIQDITTITDKVSNSLLTSDARVEETKINETKAVDITEEQKNTPPPPPPPPLLAIVTTVPNISCATGTKGTSESIVALKFPSQNLVVTEAEIGVHIEPQSQLKDENTQSTHNSDTPLSEIAMIKQEVKNMTQLWTENMESMLKRMDVLENR